MKKLFSLILAAMFTFSLVSAPIACNKADTEAEKKKKADEDAAKKKKADEDAAKKTA